MFFFLGKSAAPVLARDPHPDPDRDQDLGGPDLVVA